MYTSIKLKEESLVAYLLYMWQVEDIIRANGLDADKIDENYVSRFNLDLQQRADVSHFCCAGAAQKLHNSIGSCFVSHLGLPDEK